MNKRTLEYQIEMVTKKWKSQFTYNKKFKIKMKDCWHIPNGSFKIKNVNFKKAYYSVWSRAWENGCVTHQCNCSDQLMLHLKSIKNVLVICYP